MMPLGKMFGIAALVFINSLLLSQPRLQISGGAKFDFGEVYSGTTVNRDLILKNTGTDTLVISDISASCGCTGTMMSNDHIMAGDSGILSISFNSKKFSGNIEKAVTLNSNDASYGHVRILFTAKILKWLTLEPEYLVFHASADSAATEDLTIANSGTFPIRILSASSSTDRLSFTLTRELIHAGEEARMRCTLVPGPEGLVNGTITVRTDQPKIPVFTIRFFALVKGKSPRLGSSEHN
jgi:hypothetical protein